MEAATKTPALLTRISRRLNSAAVFSTAAVTAPELALSAWIARPRRPSFSISATTALALSGELTYVMATSAPSAARRLAMAAPMPRLPPVTRATLPWSVDMVMFPMESVRMLICCFRKPCMLCGRSRFCESRFRWSNSKLFGE